MAVTKHLKLTAGLRGCSGSGPSPGAAGCAARVEGHLYPRRLCPDLGGGGCMWDFQQAGLISCAGSCPGQGLGTRVLDHKQRPLQAGFVTILYHFLYVLLFFPKSCGKSLMFSSFHELNICRLWRFCAQHVQNWLYFPMWYLYKLTCSSEIADVPPLHVSGMHQAWVLGCLGPQRTCWSRDLRNSSRNAEEF